TKTDTVTPKMVKVNIQAFTDCISGWFEKPPAIFTCSAIAKHGRTELLRVIEEALTEAQAESEQPPQDDEALPRNLPATGRKVSARDIRGRRPNPARPW